MEVFFEQAVSNPKIDNKRVKYSILGISRSISLLLLIVVSIFYLIFFVDLTSPSTAFFSIVIFLIMVLPIFVYYFFVRMYLNRVMVEYDYFIHGDIIRIVIVLKRQKRKVLFEASLSSIESIGKVSVAKYEKLRADKDTKRVIAFCNEDNLESIYYFMSNLNGAKHLVHIEPNEEMLISLRRAIPKMNLWEK